MKKEIPEAEAPLMDKKQDEIPDEDPELEEELIKHEMEVQSIYGIDTPAPERRRLSDIYSRKNSRVCVNELFTIMLGLKELAYRILKNL